jgi:hypothetical protein
MLRRAFSDHILSNEIVDRRLDTESESLHSEDDQRCLNMARRILSPPDHSVLRLSSRTRPSSTGPEANTKGGDLVKDKIEVDGEVIGSHRNQIKYVSSRLDGKGPSISPHLHDDMQGPP